MFTLITNWLRTRDLTIIKKLHSLVWKRDSDFSIHQTTLTKIKSEYTKFQDVNKKNAKASSYYDQTRLLLVFIFIPGVACIDYALSYGVLKTILAPACSESNINFFIYLAAFGIATIELILGVLKSRFCGIDDKIPNIAWYKSSQELLRMFFSVLSLACTLIIPVLSLSEYFASISVADMLYNMGEISDSGYTQEVTGLRLRYGSLAFFSIVAHSSLVLFSPKFILSVSQLMYKVREANYKKLVKEHEKIELDSRNLILASLLEFDNSVKNYEAKYNQSIICNYRFSERVNNFYKQIK